MNLLGRRFMFIPACSSLQLKIAHSNLRPISPHIFPKIAWLVFDHPTDTCWLQGSGSAIDVLAAVTVIGRHGALVSLELVRDLLAHKPNIYICCGHLRQLCRLSLRHPGRLVVRGGAGRRLEEVIVQSCVCKKWLELSKACRVQVSVTSTYVGSARRRQ